MNRRVFLKSGVTGVAGATVLGATAFTLTGCTSGQIQQAISDIPVAENTVDIVLSLVTTASGLGFIQPQAVATITTVMGEVKVGLTAISTDLASYQTSPNPSLTEQIDTALSAISANLKTALTTAGVTDPTTAATLLGLVVLIQGVVNLVQTIIPAASKASVVRKSAQQKLKTPSVLISSNQLASLVNATMVLSRPEYQDLQVSTTKK